MWPIVPLIGCDRWADIVPLSADLDGTGTKKNYIIGLGKKNSLLVLEYDDTVNPPQYSHKLLTTSGGPNDNSDKRIKV